MPRSTYRPSPRESAAPAGGGTISGLGLRLRLGAVGAPMPPPAGPDLPRDGDRDHLVPRARLPAHALGPLPRAPSAAAAHAAGGAATALAVPAAPLPRPPADDHAGEQVVPAPAPRPPLGPGAGAGRRSREEEDEEEKPKQKRPKAAPPANPFDRLSDDLLERIFDELQFCPCAEAVRGSPPAGPSGRPRPRRSCSPFAGNPDGMLASCVLVCRRWARALGANRGLWEVAYLMDRAQISKAELRQLVRRGTYFFEFSHGTSCFTMESVVRCCGRNVQTLKLRELEAAGAGAGAPAGGSLNDVVEAVGQCCPDLRTFVLGLDNDPEMVESITEAALVGLLRRCRRLEALELSRAPVTPAVLRALALPHLRTLELLPLSTSNLDLADPAVQEAWLALFRNCPRLEKVTLRFMTLSFDLVARTGAAAPHVRQIAMEYCSGLNDGDLLEVARRHRGAKPGGRRLGLTIMDVGNICNIGQRLTKETVEAANRICPQLDVHLTRRAFWQDRPLPPVPECQVHQSAGGLSDASTGASAQTQAAVAAAGVGVDSLSAAEETGLAGMAPDLPASLYQQS